MRIEEFENAQMSKPSIIVGVPEVGLVGSIATSYIIDQLKLPEIGFIDSSLVPEVIVVHESQPKYPIRLFGKGNLAVVLSETPFTPRLSYELTAELAMWGKAKQSKMIVGVTGIPSRQRMEGETVKKPAVLAVSTTPEVRDSLKNLGAKPFDEGLMVGTYAMLLKHCMAHAQSSVTLLAESYIQFPDPGAAAAVIEILNRLLSLEVNTKNLLEESEEIRIRNRELMSKTQQAMQQARESLPGVYR